MIRRRNLAILENKEIDRFKDQYFQLMGYLNPNFQFGITVSINRRLKLFDARERIFNILNGLEGEFSPKEIHFFNQQDNGLLSKHVVPETGKIMYVYHFIMNLEDESRQAAARKTKQKCDRTVLLSRCAGEQTNNKARVGRILLGPFWLDIC